MPRIQYTLPVGGAISQSISIYVRNFVPFTFLAALVLAPWIAFRLLVPIGPYDTGLTLFEVLLSMTLSFVLTGALTYGIVQQLRGTPASMADATARGLQAFFRVLGTGLLAGLRIFLWSLLLWVPGIIESVRLFVAIPAAVMEGKGVGASLERSVRLTTGSRWQIFGAWFVTYIVLGLGLLWGAVFVTDALYPEIPDYTWLEIAVALLTAPIQATVAAVVYFMLRKGKENIAVEELAAVFD